MLGALEGALVRSYPARGELFEMQGGEYARAPVWRAIRQSEVLRVEVERRLLLLDQHPPGKPLVPRSGRGGVALGVPIQVKTDSVMGAAEMQHSLLLRRDHVIGWGDDLLQVAHDRGGIAYPATRLNQRHVSRLQGIGNR